VQFGIWFLILGCPEPVDFSDRTVDNSSTVAGNTEAPAFQANTGTGTAMPADAINSEMQQGAPPSMGTFAGDLPESEIRPRFTQEELANGAVIKGMANCPNCEGQILIRALPPPPEDPTVQTNEGMQLITQVVLEKAGNFSMYVPADAPVVLQVVDDSNGDGMPSQGERMGMREEGAVFATGVVENVSLMVGVFPKKDPIEGLGVIPTPPLPDEEGGGAMPTELVPTPTKPNNPNSQQLMPLGEQQGVQKTPPPTKPNPSGDKVEQKVEKQADPNGPPQDE
jgi:hypothetical protein